MNYNLLKIKDNGIDKRVENGVVYRRYMSHFQSALDMPLDFILHVRRIPGFQ